MQLIAQAKAQGLSMDELYGEEEYYDEEDGSMDP